MKYKLFIRQYDITTNDYKVREEIVETNDIYHTIGEIYCKSITEIKRIDYQKIDELAEYKRKLDEINSIVEYWGYDKDTNDVSCFRNAMKSIKEILESEVN